LETFKPWDHTNETRAFWKQLVRHAGKQRVFTKLEPEFQKYADRITDAHHSASDKSKSLTPLQRKKILLEALSELKKGNPGESAGKIRANAADYEIGVVGVTANVLSLGVNIVQAVTDEKKFDQSALGAFMFLHMIDPARVNALGKELWNER
jgi:hypothetical protein